MKYITFAVPCYNSQDYLDRCVKSLLIGGDDVEIILVNDGSSDRTAEIIDGYAEKYPNIVRAVHKENGGHGSGVNKGLELASGLYYKVIDSDDWAEESAYKKVLATIKLHCALNNNTDLYVVNYVYNHLDEGKQKRISYKSVLPVEEACTWNDIGHFFPSQNLIMHSLIYRTELLRESKISLPEHTFYVDNIFAYQPLPLVKSIYYLDVDFYQYYIGREDQSVSESLIIKRIDQYIKVTKIIINCVDLNEVKKEYPKLEKYMVQFISMMISVVSVHLLKIGDEEALKKRRGLWDEVWNKDKRLYLSLCAQLAGLTNIPTKVGSKITLAGYSVAKRVYKFQ